MNIKNKIYQYFIKLKGPPVKINQFCNWQSQGYIQWNECRRIVHIELFDCKWYVFVDGSKTAIPANEIILESDKLN